MATTITTKVPCVLECVRGVMAETLGSVDCVKDVTLFNLIHREEKRIEITPVFLFFLIEIS
jgi:hypothetical protein